MRNKDFAVFILTHGRPDSVVTYKTLKDQGYTGRIFLIIDNEDKTAEKYYKNFGRDNVIMFDKKAIAQTFDEFDNFDDRRAIIYARNASFEIAKDLGITYFMQLDDDYTGFYYKLLIDGPINKSVKNLDAILDLLIDFYKSTDIKTIAFAQGGDFIGGIDNGIRCYRFSQRKAMNSFLCSTKRPFQFIGRINEDVNTYTSYQAKGNVFLTLQNIALIQKQTQSNSGGMTDIYLDSGTYIKSFYTIICSPSSVSIRMMRTSRSRLHHSIDWRYTAPYIISEKHKKKEYSGDLFS